MSVGASQAGLTATFQVTNNYTSNIDIWAPSCATTGAVATCGGFAPASATLTPGQTITVTAGYSSGATPGPGTLTLTFWHYVPGGANQQDSGVLPVTVTGAPTDLTVVATPPTVTTGSNGTGLVATFTITNPYSTSVDVWAPSCVRTGSVTSCGGFAPASGTIAAGHTMTMAVTYATGAPGAGTLVLTVWNNVPGLPNRQTSGTLQVTATSTIPTPSVSLRLRTRQLERALCPNIPAGVGTEMSIQCGDLIAVHSMPAYRTLGRDRVLSLLYNGATAKPRPEVALSVNPGATAPVSVKADLFAQTTVGGAETLVSSATYAGWANQARQVVLTFDASAMPTGVYSYTVNVTSNYPAGASPPAIIKDSVIVVNRVGSRFGRGWALAGVESIRRFGPEGYPNQRILWVGGDGSARIYRPVSGALPNPKWVAPPGAYQDTLSFVDSVYVRQLRFGVEVRYDTAGRQTSTRNRTKQITRFAWGAGDSLTTIKPPPTGAGGTYTFSYTGKWVSSITDPIARSLTTQVSSPAGELLTITDPDGHGVSYLYETGTMIQWKNRAQYATVFAYTQAPLPAYFRVLNVGAAAGSAGEWGTIATVQPWDVLGLGVAGTPVAVDTANVFTRILGPRVGVNDDATIYVDSLGAPSRLINALGATTLIERKSRVCPSLVTAIKAPNGRLTRIFYDTTATSCKRGNIAQVRDSIPGGTGETPVQPIRTTTFAYLDPTAPDQPTTTTDAEVHAVVYTYNAQGLVSSILARGHTTQYFYYTDDARSGLLSRVSELSVTTWIEGQNADTVINQDTKLTYDQPGNLNSVTNPVGVATVAVNNAAGVPGDFYDPFSVRTNYQYDPLGRIQQVSRYRGVTATVPGPVQPLQACDASAIACSAGVAPPDIDSTSFPQQLLTNAYFNAWGQLSSLTDPRGVSQGYSYEARGLLSAQANNFNVSDSTIYDGGGLAVRQYTRVGFVTRMVYDALGRKTATAFDTRQWTVPVGWDTVVVRPVPGDSIRTAYDTVGLVDSTINRNGKIVNRYYRTGALSSVEWTTSAGTWKDVTKYAYDRVGTRTMMIHNQDTVKYVPAANGDLAQIQVYFKDATGWRNFQFVWDELGRRRTITYPSETAYNGVPMTVNFKYDAAGTLRRFTSANGRPGTTTSNVLQFSVANTSVDPAGRILSQTLSCTGIGGSGPAGSACGSQGNNGTVLSRYNIYGWLISQHGLGQDDTLANDLSGNINYRRLSTEGATHHFVTALTSSGHASNRLSSDTVTIGAGREIRQYSNDADGARTYEYVYAVGYLGVYWYDATGRPTGGWTGPNGGTSANPDACRFDGVGRMVTLCGNSGPWLAYDGPNASSTIVPASTTNGCGNGPCWRFVHGPGIDDPLIGLFRDPGGSGTFHVLYWVTDGQGRQYAIGRSDGSYPGDNDPSMVPQNGVSAAGSTKNAQSFQADRWATPTAPALSFFRNRIYDRNSGRWTQEDPAGVAGGMNLYEFNGNNPVTSTDPFGLRADTLDVSKDAEQDVADCRAKNAVCDAIFEKLDESNYVYHVDRLGAKEKFLDIKCKIGCTSNHISDNQAKIQYKPSEFGTTSLGIPVDIYVVLPHEGGHGLFLTPTSNPCNDDNGCAKVLENAARSVMGPGYGQR